METELDSQKKLQNTTTATDEVFTISRYIANYIFIAIIFFVIGGIVGVIGYSSNVTRNEDLIQSAVDAAYIRQAETLNELVESGMLFGEVRSLVSNIENTAKWRISSFTGLNRISSYSGSLRTIQWQQNVLIYPSLA